MYYCGPRGAASFSSLLSLNGSGSTVKEINGIRVTAFILECGTTIEVPVFRV